MNNEMLNKVDKVILQSLELSIKQVKTNEKLANENMWLTMVFSSIWTLIVISVSKYLL